MKRIIFILSVILLTACAKTVISKADLEKLDSRNEGVEITAIQKNDVLTINLEKKGTSSNVDLLRCIFQIAEELKAKKYDKVLFSFKGKNKYKISGIQFNKIGKEYALGNTDTGEFTSELKYIHTDEHVFTKSRGLKAIKDLNTFVANWTE